MLERFKRFFFGKQPPAPVRTHRERVLITGPLFVLPQGTLEMLRSARIGRIDPLVQELDAFVLDGGLGPVKYLTTDGRIVWDDDGWGVRGTLRDAFVAISIGAHKTKIQTLRGLLPQRPSSAITCAECEGTGTWQHDSFAGFCMHCASLGWTDVALNLDEYVVDSLREH